jgi:hypothetical protein
MLIDHRQRLVAQLPLSAPYLAFPHALCTPFTLCPIYGVSREKEASAGQVKIPKSEIEKRRCWVPPPPSFIQL